MTGDNGFTNKELLLKVWDEVRDHRAETKQEFNSIRAEMKEDRGRIDSLESTRDQETKPRTRRENVITAVTASVITAVIIGTLAASGAIPR